MPHTSGNILLHFVISTQRRRPFIRPEFSHHLHAYIGGIVREMGGIALIVDGSTNHVHILARIRTAQSAAQIARVIKANSSKWMHEEGNFEFAWQTGYGVFSVSQSNVAAVTKYIASQQQHHKTQSFRDEFLAFLKKNRVPYDEKYLWD